MTNRKYFLKTTSLTLSYQTANFNEPMKTNLRSSQFLITLVQNDKEIELLNLIVFFILNQWKERLLRYQR